MTEQQGAQVIALLTEIRDLLAFPAATDAACAHPDEHRTDLGSMGEDEWRCRVCGFHYGPVKRGR